MYKIIYVFYMENYNNIPNIQIFVKSYLSESNHDVKLFKEWKLKEEFW